MALTQQQITNLSKLDSDTTIEILHECAERLGLYSASDYSELSGLNIRTVYHYIKIGKLKSVLFCGYLLVVVNE